ncbi:hypothetical protein [Pseudomonas sivasensis]|uniref:Uncharacterized protein n=1 Tax=Pseudomonas sivasensis TaxID=1880678 RepID=A0ABW8DT75_9PSED
MQPDQAVLDLQVKNLIKEYVKSRYAVHGIDNIRDKIQEFLPGAIVVEFLQTLEGKNLPPRLKDEHYLLAITKSI